MSGPTNMRGLNEFISDIRECKDKESETKRVENEMAKIRERFTTEKGLNAYQRKKYIWKLLYIHILGYEVDFGYQEASALINSSKYDEKYTGYVASGLIIPENNEQIWKSIYYSVESDIRSRNEAAQSLALSLLATIMPSALYNLADTILDLALSSRTTPAVRKKALICLARMLKKEPEKFDVKKMLSPLAEIFEGKHAGALSLISGGSSLLLTILNIVNPDQLKDIQPKVIRLLHRLAINKECPSNYVYYHNPNPWLQMKLYKSLQLWSPPEDKGTLSLVSEIVTKVLKKTDASEVLNKNNIEYGLLFEVINVIIHYDTHLEKKLMTIVTDILVMFICSSRANFRYLGLESMCRLAVRHDLADHLKKILVNLDHPDVSIRKRALDLLYLICNRQNVSTIVEELLGYLENRVDPHLRDDLVLKIAILAEKFAENEIWYVDVVVRLIQNAEVENDIWYRIIQIITGSWETMQGSDRPTWSCRTTRPSRCWERSTCRT
jgi:AP-2 complex subunit alpha